MIAIQVFVVNVPVHSTICMLESVVAESFLVNEAAVLPETYSMNDWSSKQRQAGITPLDYLSQIPWIVTEANTVTQAVSAMLPIHSLTAT